MSTYNTLTAPQQAALDSLISGLAPGVGLLSRSLGILSAVDTQYLSLASAILALLQSSEFSGTDLAATVATSAAPVVTSASHNFVANDVGAVLNVTAGTNWTAGAYTIVSVNANAATLDRACASVASPTSGTWNTQQLVPNKVNLAGSQPSLSRADIVTMVSHLETCLALNDSNHRQVWVKACGPTNL